MKKLYKIQASKDTLAKIAQRKTGKRDDINTGQWKKGHLRSYFIETGFFWLSWNSLC